MAEQDIVLVDDDRVIQKMVGGFLERRGYLVRKASDGIEALQHVRDRIPDLVITDVRMPELNGIEEEVAAAVAEAIQFAEQSPLPDPKDLYEYMYSHPILYPPKPRVTS